MLKKYRKYYFYSFFISSIFFSSLISTYVQHYEYIFTDKNHIKKYKVFSDRRTLYAYYPNIKY